MAREGGPRIIQSVRNTGRLYTRNLYQSGANTERKEKEKERGKEGERERERGKIDK